LGEGGIKNPTTLGIFHLVTPFVRLLLLWMQP